MPSFINSMSKVFPKKSYNILLFLKRIKMLKKKSTTKNIPEFIFANVYQFQTNRTVNKRVSLETIKPHIYTFLNHGQILKNERRHSVNVTHSNTFFLIFLYSLISWVILRLVIFNFFFQFWKHLWKMRIFISHSLNHIKYSSQ